MLGVGGVSSDRLPARDIWVNGGGETRGTVSQKGVNSVTSILVHWVTYQEINSTRIAGCPPR